MSTRHYLISSEASTNQVSPRWALESVYGKLTDDQVEYLTENPHYRDILVSELPILAKHGQVRDIDLAIYEVSQRFSGYAMVCDLIRQKERKREIARRHSVIRTAAYDFRRWLALSIVPKD